MTKLNLEAVAIEGRGNGLLRLYVLVSDPEGSVVAGLPVEAFTCTALPPATSAALQIERMVEPRSGCYCIDLYCESKARTDLLTLSVSQPRQRNPNGFPLNYETMAEGHRLVEWSRRTSLL
jgi:hypothetical protein